MSKTSKLSCEIVWLSGAVGVKRKEEAFVPALPCPGLVCVQCAIPSVRPSIIDGACIPRPRERESRHKSRRACMVVTRKGLRDVSRHDWTQGLTAVPEGSHACLPAWEPEPEPEQPCAVPSPSSESPTWVTLRIEKTPAAVPVHVRFTAAASPDRNCHAMPITPCRPGPRAVTEYS